MRLIRSRQQRGRGSEDGQQPSDHIHPRTSFSSADEVGVLLARIAALEATSISQAATIASLTATVAAQNETIDSQPASIASFASAAQECFTDGLHVIFSFLPLIDFASVAAVCGRWAAAANSQPTRGDELTVRTELDLRAAQRSRLWRHVSVLIYDPPIEAPDMRCIMRAAIIEALQSSSSITDIRFAKLFDTGDDVKALAVALAASTTLTRWSISANRLESTASAALASAIRMSRTLRSIVLYHLVMGDGCASGLAEAIKASPTLTSVSLHRNSLTAAGRSALDAAQREVHLRQMAQHVDDMHSQDEVRQTQGVTAIRKMVEWERDSPIQQVIDAGVLPRLIEFLRSQSPVLLVSRASRLGAGQSTAYRRLMAPDALRLDTSEKELICVCALFCYASHVLLQCESAWVITYLTAGLRPIQVSQTRAVVGLGAIPALVALLSSRHSDVQEKAVCALSHITCASAEFHDQIFAAGALQQLLATCCSHGTSTSLLRDVIFFLRKLCGHKPQVDFALLRPALPVLARLIDVLDDQVIAGACQTLFLMCWNDTTPEKQIIHAVFDLGLVPRFVELMAHRNVQVRFLALTAISRICTGTRDHIAAVMRCDRVLERLRLLYKGEHMLSLRDLRERVRPAVINAIGGILGADRTRYLGPIIDANLLVPLMNDRPMEEVMRVIFIVARFATDAHIRSLASQEEFIAFIDRLVDDEDPKTVGISLRYVIRLARAPVHRDSLFGLALRGIIMISHLAQGGDDVIRDLADKGVVQPLCALLTWPKSEVITTAMECIDNMLRVCAADNPARVILREHGVDRLKALRRHDEEHISMQATEILQLHFDVAE